MTGHEPNIRHARQPDDEGTVLTRGRGRVLLWLTLAVLAVLAGVGAALAMMPLPERAPAGTYLAGAAVGGLNRAQVELRIAGLDAQVQAPVRLLIDDDSVQVKPADAGITLDRAATKRAVFAGAPRRLLERLRERRSAGRRDVAVVIAVNTKVATADLTTALSRFQHPATNASMHPPAPVPVLLDKGSTSFTAIDRPMRVTPGRTGTEVDIDAAVNALAAAVRAGNSQARLDQQVTQPSVGTSQASEVDQLIGTFTTEHPCCAPRVTNIHRIAQLVDGSVIPPGGTFSLNQAAGRRTAQNGFVSAPAIADGELVEQFGGGVSQFSTTLFNAAWFAGLDIVKHQPHSKYISRYPPGREATLDFDTIDQVIRNDTSTPVLIRTSTTATSVTVALYGHTGSRKVVSTTGPRLPQGSNSGFSIMVQRVILDSGAETGHDTLNWTYSGLD